MDLQIHDEPSIDADFFPCLLVAVRTGSMSSEADIHRGLVPPKYVI
jgi:hypothetical protein